jgi:CheY-like chemotaxis protein
MSCHPTVKRNRIKTDQAPSLQTCKGGNMLIVAAPKLKLLSLNGLKVLLVEDPPISQFFVRQFLEKEGALVEIARDGIDAVAKTEDMIYDVIIMDIQDPYTSGMNALTLLHARYHGPPVIVLSRQKVAQEHTRARACGYAGFISQPIHRNEMIDTINEVVNLKFVH